MRTVGRALPGGAIPLSETFAAEVLFGDTRFRPTPQTMQSLIEQGLTEDTILAAAETKGYMPPIMDLTLKELKVALPFFQRISDKLADDHAEDTLLFAGRDAEAVFDDFAITHPDTTNYLLPASTNLWYSRGMRDKGLATTFLGKFGLTEQAITDQSKKYVLVDSGFYGSIGQKVDKKVEELYGVSLRSVGRLAIKLVSAEHKGLGSQILDFPDAANIRWPKFHKDRRIGFPRGASGNTYGLAVGMQLMPRYHGTYEELASIKGDVMAVPSKYEAHSRDVNSTTNGINSSIINPVAAAIVQFRIVKAASERRQAMENGTNAPAQGRVARLRTALRGLLKSEASPGAR